MLFNSFSFVFFLPIVFIIYWLLDKRSLKVQNLILLIASYYFYSCWDYRFLFLLIFSTFLDYYTGIKISDSTNNREKKIWFWTSVLTNIGFLAIFKYFNFFANSFKDALLQVGLSVDPWILNVILPVGISFYTFHGLSYVIDIYKDRIKPEIDFINYSLFVSFFPLLVAGPIERANHLLPQIIKKRTFNYFKAVDGLKQILWGFFKKIVVADNCAEQVNLIFNDYSNLTGSHLALGAIFFSFQIYGDFSGYSDIAQGTARLFGIELLRNFAFPYFSRDVGEFWRRWHISLSSWFRDYLYIPLGGSKSSTTLKVRNTFIIFLVSGFWHGANWTFIAWGGLNALYFLPLLLLKKNRANLDTVAAHRSYPSLSELFNMLYTFSLITIAWVFFRSDSIYDAVKYIGNMCKHPGSFLLFELYLLHIKIFAAIFILIIIEWISRNDRYGIEKMLIKSSRFYKWSFYSVLLVLIFYMGNFEETNFIYFQF